MGLGMSYVYASGWVKPCKAVLVKEPPAGSDWIHEIKHDGYRIIAVIAAGNARIFTRRGLDWSSRMPSIRAALEALPVTSATIDGEAIVAGQDGISDFFALHQALAAGNAPDAGLIAFDLIELDGKELRDDAIEARRKRLKRLIGSTASALQFSDEIGGEGKDALHEAREMGLEGIVSKRRGSPYRSGRNPNWRKTKCTLLDFFAIIGAEPTRGSVRSLKVAHLRNGILTPCGSVGSGLTEAEGTKLRAAMDAKRALIAEVEYRGFTPAGELRHPVLRGWREG
jgi:bifunctional non-homologous end joining protein LigD